MVAKQVATTRKLTTQMYTMNAQLKGISMQLQSMNTQVQVMDSMGNATKIMGKVNKDMNVNEIMQMMKEYQKEQMKFEIKGRDDG